MCRAAVFVYLDIRLKDYLGARHHLGAAYIRAFLDQHGISSTQYLASPTRSFDAIADDIASDQPVFVGFTVFDRNFHLVRLLAHKIRQRLPSAMIVAGGPTATFSYKLLLERCTAFDACVLHHGEEASLALLSPLMEGRKPDFDQIPQVAMRTCEGVRVSAAGEFDRRYARSSSLDRFPSPYLTWSIPPEMGPQVGVVTARGCPFHCSYCNFSAMSNRIVQYHSIARTVDELRTINRAVAPRRAPARLEILDDVFTVNRNRVTALCAAIESAGLRNLTFWCETRADLVDDELLSQLARAGVTEINFGLESTNREVLTNIHKMPGGAARHEHFLEQIRQAVIGARRAGIAPFVSLIFGLPGETSEIAHRTLEFIESLPIEGYSHNFLHVEPGTELWHTHAQFGIRVTEGPQILPYRTIHAYDVHREVPVRPLKMSLERATRSAHAMRVAQRLSGDIEPGLADGPLQCLFLSETVAPNKLRDTWWMTAIGPATATTILVPEFDAAKYDDWLASAAENNLPLFRFDVAAGSDRQRLLADDRPALDGPPEYRIRRIESHNELYGGSHALEHDILVFRNLSPKLPPERAADLINELADKDPRMLGETTLEPHCRWTCRTCPAATYSAAWVNDEGVRPCAAAPSTPAVSLPVLRSEESAAYVHEQKRRGCAECEVRETCPKCLHTAPLTPSDYCRIQRGGKMIEAAMLIEISQVLDRVERQSIRPVEEPLRLGNVLPANTCLVAEWRTTKTLVVAYQGRSSLLYEPETRQLWRISEAISLLLELAGLSELSEIPNIPLLCQTLQDLQLAAQSTHSRDGNEGIEETVGASSQR